MTQQKEMLKVILTETVELDNKKKLSCTKAFAIANQYGWSLSEIGKICNDAGIKIMHCQLNCF